MHARTAPKQRVVFSWADAIFLFSCLVLGLFLLSRLWADEPIWILQAFYFSFGIAGMWVIKRAGEIVSHLYICESTIFQNSCYFYSIIIYLRPTIQPIHKNKNSSKNMLGYQKKFQKTCKAIRKIFKKHARLSKK